MQVFRLVNGGFVDKMIAFDSLPKRILSGVRTRDIAGMPRHWGRWLEDAGCVRDVFKTETETRVDRSLHVTRTVVGKEPCFYLLDYMDLNVDKEKWQEICNYVRKAVDTKVRLLDKLDDMAKKMAPDSHAQLDLEPEDIPVIVIPAEVEDVPRETKTEEMYLTPQGESADAPKRRGRPKKVAVEA
jgi:hypothetical protein